MFSGYHLIVYQCNPLAGYQRFQTEELFAVQLYSREDACTTKGVRVYGSPSCLV